MVYPTLLAVVADVAHPTWRARSLSVYRFWRDMGYAVGALLAGFIGDAFGLTWAIAGVGLLTFGSGAIVAFAMQEAKWVAPGMKSALGLGRVKTRCRYGRDVLKARRDIADATP